jgi:hypothetical protein
MPRRAAWATAVIGLALALAACSRLGSGASPTPTALAGVDSADAVMPADLVSRAKVDLSPIPAAVPAAAVGEEKASATAETHIFGGASHGTLIGASRGRAKLYEDASDPVRTVWVFVYGPGGQVQVEGPPGGYQDITMQVVLVDDQTGEFLRGETESAPSAKAS